MRPNSRALLFGLAAVSCWSTVATAFKLALAEVSVPQLLLIANVTAVTILLLAVLIKGQLLELVTAFKDHTLLTLISGSLNPVIYYLVLFAAYDALPAQVASSINYTWAIVLTFMAIVFLKQKILAADILAAAVCYVGVFIIATQGDIGSFRNSEPLGLALALISTIVWASYWTLNIRDQRDPTIGLCLNFMIALPISLSICLGFSDLTTISWQGGLTSVYVGVVEMAVGFLLWSTALKLTDNASRVSNLIFLSPVASLFFINSILEEAIFWTTYVGLALIIAGLLFQQYQHRRHEALE